MAEIDDIFGMLRSIAEGEEPEGLVRDVIAILDTMESDIAPILALDCGDQTGAQRRAAFRAAFALIEGLTYFLKQFALDIDESLQRRLSAQERMAIDETVVRIDESGRLRVRKDYPATMGNVRFAFLVLEKATASEFHLDVSGIGWDAFKKSTAVRHRITHPKKASDLEITETEMKWLTTAHVCFLRSLVTALFLALRGIVIAKHQFLRTVSDSPSDPH